MNKLICIPTIVIVTSVHQFLQLRRLELDHCSLSVALATCVVRDILPLRSGYGGLKLVYVGGFGGIMRC